MTRALLLLGALFILVMGIPTSEASDPAPPGEPDPTAAVSTVYPSPSPAPRPKVRSSYYLAHTDGRRVLLRTSSGTPFTVLVTEVDGADLSTLEAMPPRPPAPTRTR